jgi:pimeloyl-ACP methyl ester carboxylesterase
MNDIEPQMIEVGEGAQRRRIAVAAEHRAGASEPGYFWLSGFKSDMTSTKASAIAQRARQRGVDCVRFDYSGHGCSEGRFEDGTIGRWLEEAAAVFAAATRGPQIVIGSSMGGYIALLLLRRLLSAAPKEALRIRALVLIAPAWDMTEELMWRRFPEHARQGLLETGQYLEPSAYGEPYLITRALIEEGRRHRLRSHPFDPGRPVLILQGARDPDVPIEHVRTLSQILAGDWVELDVIADGEHRLSRPGDLEALDRLIDRAVARSTPASA